MSSFVEEVAAAPGGENIWDCIQCGICTGSCPAADEMEYPPRKIIAMIRAGIRDDVLSSSSMWHCLSCYMCTVRCPKGVKPTELAHALEYLATQKGFKVKGTRTPAMYRSFINSIKRHGRVHEFVMMFMFYLKTGLLWATSMLPMALKLFRRGRIPLKPHRIKGRNELKLILEKFAKVRGAQ